MAEFKSTDPEAQKVIEGLESIDAVTKKVSESMKEALDTIEKTEKAKLSEIAEIEKNINDTRSNEISIFLNKRADLEGVSGDERIDFLKKQGEELLKSDELIAEAKVHIADTVKTETEKIEKEITKKQKENLKERFELMEDYKEKVFTVVNVIASFMQNYIDYEKMLSKDRQDAIKEDYEKRLEDETLNSEQRTQLKKDMETKIKEIQEDTTKKTKDIAKTNRAIASGEAFINSWLGFTKALATGIPPWNFIQAASVLSAGIAAQIKIFSAPLGVETGGHFFVPNTGGVVDSTYLRVNSGEEIDVTPRGQVGYGNEQHIIVKIDEQVIFAVVNRGIKAGDILISADNV